MNSLTKRLTWQLFPAIVIRFFALAFSDIISVLISVKLGNLLSLVITQNDISNYELYEFCVLFFSSFFISPVMIYLSNKLIFRISIATEETVFQSVLNQAPSSFASMDCGDLSCKIIDSGITLRWAIIDFYVGLLNCGLLAAMLAWFIFNVSATYTYIILCLVVINYIKSLFFSPIISKNTIRNLQEVQHIKAKILSSASHFHFLSINKLTKHIQCQLLSKLSRYTTHVMPHIRTTQIRLNTISMFLECCFHVIILFVGIYLASHKGTPIGLVFTMSSYYELLSTQIANVDTIIKSKKTLRSILEDISFAVNRQIAPEKCEFTKLEIQPFQFPMRSDILVCRSPIEINQGDKVAIIGGNGSGKTTFLSMLFGLEDFGEILIKSNNMPISIGTIRFLSDYIDINANSLEDSVSQYVLSGSLRSSSQASETVVRYELDSIWNQSTDTLSGGQRKRVEFARTELHKKRILALDEPEVGLDPYWRNKISNFLKSSSQTVIFTTHDESFLSIANKTITITNGEISLTHCEEVKR